MRPPRLALIALVCTALPIAGQAEWLCTLTDIHCAADCAETTVRFDIDPNQFVAPQNPDDPPRRQITQVTLNDTRFTAQAIAMEGGIQGFHEDAGALGSRLMIVRPDGAARLTLQPGAIRLAGTCLTED